MKSKDQLLKKIRRDYRIEPSTELLDFWKTVEKKKLQEDYIPFRYFKIKLFTLEQVAEFNFKKIRFWFKKRPQVHLVRYYIPLASVIASSEFTLVAAYDSAKHFIGVFFCNLLIDPIFITADLFSLLNQIEPEKNKAAFLEEVVSKRLIKEFNFDQFYPEIYDEEKKQELLEKNILEVFEYIKMIFEVIHYNEKLEIKSLKKSFKIFFQPRNKNNKEVRYTIEIPKSDYDGFSTILPVLNLINYRMWNSDSDMIAEYGFYRISNGIVMLQVEQLCEFIRLGIVPPAHNVHFPPIIYSSQSSGYANPLKYEIGFFETQEAYNEYAKSITISRYEKSARRMQQKDIPRIVDYFLDTHSLLLLDAGIEAMKIPSEEKLIENLQLSLNAKDDKKHQFYVMFDIDIDTRGHGYIEKIKKGKEAYFYFFYWDNVYNKPEIIDELIEKSIQVIQEAYDLKTIYAENLKKDDYRNEAFKRAGFEWVKEQETARDEMSVKGIYNLWKLTF